MTQAPAGPLVSVVMITYNHELFIREALESVLTQQADFPIEVIVADDASTDRTADIVAELAEAHPAAVRPVLRTANIGIHANLVDALDRTQGTYVALCEGDDYWTDPLKLSRQVAFMEANPSTALCFHPVRVTWSDLSAPDEEFPTSDRVAELTLNALLADNFIQTNSVLYRRLQRYDDIPDVMPLDWYLHIRHAMTGAISMLPESMAVYRRHPGGVWSDAVTHHARFWTAHGPGHAAMTDALLDLFGDDPVKRHLVSELARRVLIELSRVDSEGVRPSALLDTISAHPRWAELACRRLASDYETSAQDLDHVQSAVAHLQSVHEDSQARISALEHRVEEQRKRLRSQKRRIETLRDRVQQRTEEAAALRRRLLGERFRGLARRVRRRG